MPGYQFAPGIAGLSSNGSTITASLPLALGSNSLTLSGLLTTGGLVNGTVQLRTFAGTIAETTLVSLGDATSASFTLTLPIPSGACILYVFKVDASVNIVTVQRQGSATINGALTKDLTVRDQGIMLVWDSPNNRWHGTTLTPA